MLRAKLKSIAALLCLFYLPMSAATADAEGDLLGKVKTAYLFNIAKFVVWPNANSEVMLCVHPSSRLLRLIRKLDEREIGASRRLKVVTLKKVAAKCQIYYTDYPVSVNVTVADSMHANISAFGAETKTNRVLSISDHPESLARGYVMQLHVGQGKLRFRYGKEALARSTFSVSSKLLALARP